MSRILSGVLWVVLYLLVVLSPMFLMVIDPRPPGRDFWVEFSVALGFVGLTQIAVQFALIARFRRVTAPYGIDIILRYHRQIALVAVSLILLHPIILAANNPALWQLFNPLGGTLGSRMGLSAVVALVILVALSLFRERIRLNYEVWRITHALLAVTAVVLAQVHVSMTGLYINTAWKQSMWIVFSALMIGLIVYLRLIKPILQKRQPYRVEDVKEERADTWALTLKADGHEGIKFLPGQFAWLKFGRSPFTIEEHPFSFSSSAEHPERIEFGIKELGDFTSRVKDIPPGTPAYIDGPHGAFSVDRTPAAGYVFIVGGIGISPVMGIIRTLADRDDPRPLLLIYGDKTWDAIAYRDELEELKDRLDLEIAYVLEDPHEDWEGEAGFVTAEILDKRLPDEKITREYFVCGPDVMMDAVEKALLANGVSRNNIHMERFNLV
ncbi:MAG: ferric reductase-like transmembrane domain-containing protein [Dehalococcoidia bacterium]